MSNYGIAGLGAGAGKDTIAKAIIAKDPSIVRIGFADKIKEIAADVLGLTVEEVNRIKDDETHPDCQRMRTLLQVIGTEAFRAYDENVWVNYALRRVQALKAEGYNVVIPDLRFPNEFEALASNEFCLVDVQCRPDQLRIGPDHPRYNHPSERGLDRHRELGLFHVTLMNDRETPVDDLVNQIFAASAST